LPRTELAEVLMQVVNRRSFLQRTVQVAGAGVLFPPSVRGLVSACTQRDAGGLVVPRTSPVDQAGPGRGGYGDLVPGTGILLLPAGFACTSFGVAGELMSDGNVTPLAHDGMAAFGWQRNRVRLIRNHEVTTRGAPLSAVNAYDPSAGGGTTTTELEMSGPEPGDGRGRGESGDADFPGHPAICVVRSFVSLSGTIVNCAGGPTPWRSWLSCEENVRGVREGFTRTHGWVFDVPVAAEGPVAPVPLKDMGRMSHEAVAVDPHSGIVYETEDNAFPPGSGFYRFLPRRPGELARGGRLQMARIAGSPRLQIFRGSAIGIRVGDAFDVEWVDIRHPDPDPNDALAEDDRRMALFTQGADQGAAAFNRLEGCWYGDGSIYFHDTRGGAAGCGHVWRYLPGQGNRDGGRLVLLFESPGAEVLDSPDNLTVSPRGGLVVCEDGSDAQFIRGLTPAGEIFPFAKNNISQSEFAGACYSPDGRVLFVNIQGAHTGDPLTTEPAQRGVTIAITGPFHRGAL